MGDFVIKKGVLKKYQGKNKHVIIPDGVTDIGYSAFSGCSNLTSIIIPAGVTFIDSFAFNDCSHLTSITIPDSVTVFGTDIFSGCNKLNKIVFKNPSIKIDRKIIGYSLPEFFILVTDNLSNVAREFQYNAILGFVDSNADLSSENGKEYIRVIKNNVAKLVDIAIAYPPLLSFLCREKLIPAKCLKSYISSAQSSNNTEAIATLLNYESTSVTEKEKKRASKQTERDENSVLQREIDRSNKTGIKGLNFAVDGTLHIFSDRDQLLDCLKKSGATLKDTVSSKVDFLIANYTKSNSTKICRAKELGIEIISEQDLINKAGGFFIVEKGELIRYLSSPRISSVTIPKTVKHIGSFVFDGCNKLTSVIIPDSVTEIDAGAFRDCSKLTSISIPDSVASFGSDVFKGCKGLEDKNGLIIIGNILYGYNGKAKDIKIPNSVTRIENWAFHECYKLASVTIPNSVKEMGEGIFSYCENLVSIIIPDGVTEIKRCAFIDCSKLKNITIPDSVKKISSESLLGCSDKLTIYASANSYANKYALEHDIQFKSK